MGVWYGLVEVGLVVLLGLSLPDSEKNALRDRAIQGDAV